MRIIKSCLSCKHLSDVVNTNTVRCSRMVINKYGLIEEQLSELPICKCQYFKSKYDQESVNGGYFTNEDKFLFGKAKEEEKKKKQTRRKKC